MWRAYQFAVLQLCSPCNPGFGLEGEAFLQRVRRSMGCMISVLAVCGECRSTGDRRIYKAVWIRFFVESGLLFRGALREVRFSQKITTGHGHLNRVLWKVITDAALTPSQASIDSVEDTNLESLMRRTGVKTRCVW